MTRYVLDTNVYIDAIRSRHRAAELERFCEAVLPFLYLSAVVQLELHAGAKPPAARALEHDLFAPFERRGRVVVPSRQAYRDAGRLLGHLLADGGTAPPGLTSDALLATSCREVGMTLVSSDRRDFSRIASHLRGFRWALPWPSP